MLGIKICRLADAVGLTQAAIAEHLGVDRAQVNRWAKGVRPVPEVAVGQYHERQVGVRIDPQKRP